MKTINLIRLAYTTKGVPGVFLCGGRIIGLSLEPPFKDNEKNISCIPEGIYVGTYDGERNKHACYRVHDVFSRSGILIHVGNTIKDTQGCILIGTSFKFKKEETDDFLIQNSGEAMDYLYEVVWQNNFWLKITS